MILERDILAKMLPKLPGPKLDTYLPYLNEELAKNEINTRLRIAMFVAQIAVESAELTRWEENLNYSAEALQKLWPARYTASLAAQQARKPELIANHVYASRFGNRDTASGDGWRYRGRGPKQITFLDNYRQCGTAIGLDLVAHPELLLQPGPGIKSAVWYWTSRRLNVLADLGDVRAVTLKINGGYNGIEERTRYYRQNLALVA